MSFVVVVLRPFLFSKFVLPHSRFLRCLKPESADVQFAKELNNLATLAEVSVWVFRIWS